VMARPKKLITWRTLRKGEIIREGDEVDMCNNGWHDDAKWAPARCIGKPAPDPSFPSHRVYRRPVVKESPT